MVVILIEGVVYEPDPLNKSVPPVEALYQSIVSPAPGEAKMVTDPVPHLDALVPPAVIGFWFTVALTAALVAEMQPVLIFLDSA
jgi:hypothetical protein